MSQRVVVCMFALVALFFFGCATPRFEDGTRTTIAPSPCTPDNCGKPAWR